MKVQRGFEGECIRAKGPQEKVQHPAAATVCSDMKDIQEIIRVMTVNEAKRLLMLLLFNTGRSI